MTYTTSRGPSIHTPSHTDNRQPFRTPNNSSSVHYRHIWGLEIIAAEAERSWMTDWQPSLSDMFRSSRESRLRRRWEGPMFSERVMKLGLDQGHWLESHLFLRGGWSAVCFKLLWKGLVKPGLLGVEWADGNILVRSWHDISSSVIQCDVLYFL